jgi:hypothetical protein
MRISGLCVGSMAALLVATAAAQPAQETVPDLLRQLEEEHAALSTADCRAACRALEALERLVGRICALDPGQPCADARKKLDDASARVRDACGDCGDDLDAKPNEAKTPGPVLEGAPGADEEQAESGRGSESEPAGVPAAAPPEAEKKGGCAACSVGRRSEPTTWAWLLPALAWLARRSAARTRRRGR